MAQDWLNETSWWTYIGDFDGDIDVDMADLEILCDSWLTDDPVTDIAPAGGDGIVNMIDFAVFAKNWYKGTTP